MKARVGEVVSEDEREKVRSNFKKEREKCRGRVSSCTQPTVLLEVEDSAFMCTLVRALGL